MEIITKYGQKTLITEPKQQQNNNDIIQIYNPWLFIFILLNNFLIVAIKNGKNYKQTEWLKVLQFFYMFLCEEK